MSSGMGYSALHRYVELDESYYAAYEAYHPNVSVLQQVYTHLPAAHVIVFARRTCPDCLRNIPAMARIAEHLPSWTWEVLESDAHPDQRLALGIVRIPTFIICDRSGERELGRIVENPLSGSLEYDLLDIVRPYGAA